MYKKRYYKFTEKLMFAIVMRDEELCRELLERLIPERKIRKICFPENPAMDYLAAFLKNGESVYSGTATVEKTIITGLLSKSVRLDVLFEDDEVWYNIEMQVNPEVHLPQRTRYYHASMAVGILDAGQLYSDLKPSYVIFICMFDYFGEGESVYRFQMLEEKKHLPLNDGQFTIMVNMECPEENIPEELRTFYSFVNHGEVAENDPFICKIHNRVEQANRCREVCEIMTVEDEIRMLEQFRADLEQKIGKLHAANQQLASEKEQLEGANQQLASEKEQLEGTNQQLTSEKEQLEDANQFLEQKQRLTEILLLQERFDDLKKAVNDDEYVKQLLQELNLN